jgi:hypothetical protein
MKVTKRPKESKHNFKLQPVKIAFDEEQSLVEKYHES